LTGYVVDAAAIAELLLRTPAGERVRETIAAPSVALHVPALCDVEVGAVLRKALIAGRLDVDRAGDALQDYLDLPLTRHGHTALLPRILALRSNFSAYDATYVALAERIGAVLVSADGALVRAVRQQLDLEVVSAMDPSNREGIAG
jgi:predicted nucleic acid-binding protein